MFFGWVQSQNHHAAWTDDSLSAEGKRWTDGGWETDILWMEEILQCIYVHVYIDIYIYT